MPIFHCLLLMIWTWSGFLLDLVWTLHRIKSIIALPSSKCAHLCVDVCGVKCVSIRVVHIFHQLQKCSSLAGCVQQCGLEPWSRSPPKPKPELEMAVKPTTGPLLYLDWQTNSSFTQALFTKGSHPHLWESCL